MENKKETFEYTYSAAQQDEIEKIRRKYLPKEDSTEDKMELLRKLDRDVTKSGTIWGLVLGILGCLILGTGMSCCMVWADSLFVIGIIVGVLGMVVIGLAYPVYAKITARERERIAPKILALTEELSK